MQEQTCQRGHTRGREGLCSLYCTPDPVHGPCSLGFEQAWVSCKPHCSCCFTAAAALPCLPALCCCRDLLAEKNYQHMLGLANGDAKRIPQPDSRVYQHGELSRSEWARVLAWGCSMDHALRTKGAKVCWHQH